MTSPIPEDMVVRSEFDAVLRVNASLKERLGNALLQVDRFRARIKELEEAPLNLPGAVEAKKAVAERDALLRQIRELWEVLDATGCDCGREGSQEHGSGCTIPKVATLKIRFGDKPQSDPNEHAHNCTPLGARDCPHCGSCPECGGVEQSKGNIECCCQPMGKGEYEHCPGCPKHNDHPAHDDDHASYAKKRKDEARCPKCKQPVDNVVHFCPAQ